MTRYNPANERIKKHYLTFLAEARGQSEASIDAVAKALSRFEHATGHRDFKLFHRDMAVSFKRKLDAEVNARTGAPLSRATVYATLQALRAFFVWLADRPGYRRKLSYSDADYFNLSEKDARVAKTRRTKPAPTVEQIHHVLGMMPARTDIELRDRAVIAFTLLTGARDGAIPSFRLKHVDLAARRLDQDAREVRTKFSKTFSTWFFPVGGEALAILERWMTHQRTVLLRGGEDPLFPATRVGQSARGGFEAQGLGRDHWRNADPIRRIFARAFKDAGSRAFNPHSLRDTLVKLGEQLCKTPEEFKAWSQNLGHAKVLTTFMSYGAVPEGRQAELIERLGTPTAVPSGEDFDQRLTRLEARLG